MKAKELIEKLELCDKEAEVYIGQCAYPGYEINDVINSKGIVELE